MIIRTVQCLSLPNLFSTSITRSFSFHLSVLTSTAITPLVICRRHRRLLLCISVHHDAVSYAIAKNPLHAPFSSHVSFLFFTIMKFSTLAMLPVAAMAAPHLSDLERRAPAMNAESVKELQPKLRQGAKRTLTRWGPYKLAGHDVCCPISSLCHSSRKWPLGAREPSTANTHVMQEEC